MVEGFRCALYHAPGRNAILYPDALPPCTKCSPVFRQPGGNAGVFPQIAWPLPRGKRYRTLSRVACVEPFGVLPIFRGKRRAGVWQPGAVLLAALAVAHEDLAAGRVNVLDERRSFCPAHIDLWGRFWYTTGR